MIEKALADLDAKIGEWTESLRSAQSQLRGAFAPKPVVPGQRPSAALFDAVPRTSLSEAAAAAHIPTPPPPPDWSKLGAASTPPEWVPPAAAPAPAWSGQQAAPSGPPVWGGQATAPPPAWNQGPSAPPPTWNQPAAAPPAAWGAPPPPAGGAEWAQPPGAPAQFAPAGPGPADPSSTGVMPWPSTPTGPQSVVSFPEQSNSQVRTFEQPLTRSQRSSVFGFESEQSLSSWTHPVSPSASTKAGSQRSFVHAF